MFLAGAAPPGLLAALSAFFPAEGAPREDQRNSGDDTQPQSEDQDLGLELDVHEDEEFLLTRLPPFPPKVPPIPPLDRGGGGGLTSARPAAGRPLLRGGIPSAMRSARVTQPPQHSGPRRLSGP